MSEVFCVVCPVASFAEESLVMPRYCRIAVKGALVLVLVALAACVAAQAPKVQCDSNLRPINAGTSDKP